MVFDHRDHGVGEGLLLRREPLVQVLVKLSCQLLNYDGRVGDFVTIQLNEGQLSLFWAKLYLVVDILWENKRILELEGVGRGPGGGPWI